MHPVGKQQTRKRNTRKEPQLSHIEPERTTVRDFDMTNCRQSDLRDTYQESQTMQLLTRSSSIYNNDRGGENYDFNSIKHNMTQPKPNRIAQSIRKLHGLNRRSTLSRNVQGKKCRVNGLRIGHIQVYCSRK